jgi:hypothetical protein
MSVRIDIVDGKTPTDHLHAVPVDLRGIKHWSGRLDESTAVFGVVVDDRDGFEVCFDLEDRTSELGSKRAQRSVITKIAVNE